MTQTEEERAFWVAWGTRLREHRDERGYTADFIAARAQSRGLAWTQSTVMAIEAGRRRLTLLEGILLGWIYGVSVMEVLSSRDRWEMTDAMTPTGDAAARLLGPAHGKVTVGEAMSGGLRERLEAAFGETEQELGRAERRAAKSLGIAHGDLLELAARVFGRPFSLEWARRVEELELDGAPSRTVQAKRGHVTRQMLAELRQHQP